MEDNPEDADSPIWTAQDFATARPASDMLPPHLARLLVRRPPSGLKDGLALQPPWARGFGLAA